jgi:hypothetical protein
METDATRPVCRVSASVSMQDRDGAAGSARQSSLCVGIGAANRPAPRPRPRDAAEDLAALLDDVRQALGDTAGPTKQNTGAVRFRPTAGVSVRPVLTAAGRPRSAPGASRTVQRAGAPRTEVEPAVLRGVGRPCGRWWPAVAARAVRWPPESGGLSLGPRSHPPGDNTEPAGRGRALPLAQPEGAELTHSANEPTQEPRESVRAQPRELGSPAGRVARLGLRRGAALLPSGRRGSAGRPGETDVPWRPGETDVPWRAGARRER